MFGRLLGNYGTGDDAAAAVTHHARIVKVSLGWAYFCISRKFSNRGVNAPLAASIVALMTIKVVRMRALLRAESHRVF